MPREAVARGVIDAHVHLVPSSRLFSRWARHAGADHSLRGLRREMASSGVERAVLVSHWDGEDATAQGPFTNRTNNELVRLVGRAGDRFRGVLTANVGRTGVADLELLQEHLARRSIVGVKFFCGYEPFAPDDARLEPILDMLERRGAVAMFHTGDTLLEHADLKYARPLAIDKVANRHRRLRIVVAHAGQHWMAEAGELLGKHRNVHADLSGWFIGRRLPWFADMVRQQFRELIFWADGVEKLMFGTDWPLMRMAPYLEFLEGCEFLSEAQLRRVLYENAKRLYWG